jgi:hypothetical protein
MNCKELDLELQQLGVASQRYNLQGDLISDTIILYNSYDTWEVFYFDERGGKNDVKKFKSECEACWYIFKLFRDAIIIEKKFK